MTALVHAHVGRVAARANWGRWIVDCPWCPNARTLQPGTGWLHCSACGGVAEIVWPSAEMVAGVERLLLMRPNEASRNWEPGETLAQLMMENGAHGIFDRIDSLCGTPGLVLLSATDDQIPIDLLPVTAARTLRAVGN